jgi:hypothetical protein
MRRPRRWRHYPPLVDRPPLVDQQVAVLAQRSAYGRFALRRSDRALASSLGAERFR